MEHRVVRLAVMVLRRNLLSWNCLLGNLEMLGYDLGQVLGRFRFSVFREIGNKFLGELGGADGHFPN